MDRYQESVWTEERVERLKELWHAPISASDIARKLGVKNANAVWTKASRLNLGKRPHRYTCPLEKISQSEAPRTVLGRPFVDGAIARHTERARGMVAAGMTPQGACNQVFQETGYRVTV